MELPIIFVIENNQYAMGTSVNRASAEDQLYRRGESFRIPGMQVDGMDVLAVRGAAEAALEWVRAGKGPVLMELKTYRYRGHRCPTRQTSQPRGSAGGARQADAIEHLKKLMQDAGIGEDKIKDIDKEIRAIVAESADFAESAPEPELSELYTDVLVEQY